VPSQPFDAAKLLDVVTYFYLRSSDFFHTARRVNDARAEGPQLIEPVNEAAEPLSDLCFSAPRRTRLAIL